MVPYGFVLTAALVVKDLVLPIHQIGFIYGSYNMILVIPSVILSPLGCPIIW
jgi:hypothetical protein